MGAGGSRGGRGKVWLVQRGVGRGGGDWLGRAEGCVGVRVGGLRSEEK